MSNFPTVCTRIESLPKSVPKGFLGHIFRIKITYPGHFSCFWDFVPTIIISAKLSLFRSFLGKCPYFCSFLGQRPCFGLCFGSYSFLIGQFSFEWEKTVASTRLSGQTETKNEKQRKKLKVCNNTTHSKRSDQRTRCKPLAGISWHYQYDISTTNLHRKQ